VQANKQWVSRHWAELDIPSDLKGLFLFCISLLAKAGVKLHRRQRDARAKE